MILASKRRHERRDGRAEMGEERQERRDMS